MKHLSRKSQTSEIRMAAKKTKTNENDFDAMDRLAHSITPRKLRPLTPKQKVQWEAAKRGRPNQRTSEAEAPPYPPFTPPANNNE